MDVIGSLETLLQVSSAGLVIGCIYGLMCAGLGLIFGVMRVTNFAQADFMMLGMYFGLFVITLFIGDAPTPVYLLLGTALLAGAVFCVVGALTHKFLIGAVTGTRAARLDDSGHTGQLILTLGLSLVIQNAALMFIGSRVRSINAPISRESWVLGPLWGEDIMIFFNKARVWSAAIGLVAVAAVLLVMRYTAVGRRLRAAANNPTAAVYMGVNVDQSHRIAFALGIGLTGISGVMLATYYPFQPYVGFDFVIIMYTGVVLGGIGSIVGAYLGGVIIGVVQQVSTLFLPTQLQTSAIFVLFLIILMLRPQGLFGRSVDRA